jgi:hypothetical protein
MRYTREASVRLSATPPAFKLTRNTVTSTLFTDFRGQLHIAAIRLGGRRTKMLDGGISSLGTHRPFKTTDLDNGEPLFESQSGAGLR